MACKPALALAAMSKAMEVWMDNVDEALRNVSVEMARSLAVQELRLVLAFLVEAPIDIIHLVAWVILSSVTAKHALWHWPWLVDPALYPSRRGVGFLLMVLCSLTTSWTVP